MLQAKLHSVSRSIAVASSNWNWVAVFTHSRAETSRLWLLCGENCQLQQCQEETSTFDYKIQRGQRKSCVFCRRLFFSAEWSRWTTVGIVCFHIWAQIAVFQKPQFWNVCRQTSTEQIFIPVVWSNQKLRQSLAAEKFVPAVPLTLMLEPLRDLVKVFSLLFYLSLVQTL